MVINTLKIRNFGKIHDRTLELSEGINVLYGENESGKTTIHTFLKSMLFGMARLRGKGARTDTYSTYEPWENPADYGGTIWFTQEGCEYRLTRNFERSHPVFELVRLTDGAVFTDEEEIAALLGEVSEAVYDNTVSVGQLKSVTGKDLVRELQNYMASYQGTGDTSLDLGRAAQMLKMSRKGFQVQAERRKKELQKEQEKLDAGMDLLEKEMTDLQTKRGRIDEKGQSLRLGENGGDVLLRHIREARKTKAMSILLFGILALLAAAAGLLIGDIRVRIGAGVLAVLLLTVGVIRSRSLEKEIRKRQKLRERWLAKNRKLRYDRSVSDAAIDDKRRSMESLQSARAEIEDLLRKPFPEEKEVEALNLAMETIGNLSGDMNRQVGQRLKNRTSEILSGITGGKYHDVLLDEDLKRSVNTRHRVFRLEKLSRGTLEQIYFSLRMAAGELFCGQEPFPVILDDIFGMYDEERLAGVLRWLYKEQKQIIISTCSKREMDVLEKEQIPFRGLLL